MNNSMTRITCPSCQKQLKTGKQLQPGKIIKCPSCGNRFEYQQRPQATSPPATESPAASRPNTLRTVAITTGVVAATFLIGLACSQFLGKAKPTENHAPEVVQASDTSVDSIQPEPARAGARRNRPTTTPTYSDREPNIPNQIAAPVPVQSTKNESTPEQKQAETDLSTGQRPGERVADQDQTQDNLLDDSNRPRDRQAGFDLPADQPKGGLMGGFAKLNPVAPAATPTIVRQIPVLIPYYVNTSRPRTGKTNGQKSAKGNTKSQKPSVNVVIKPVVSSVDPTTGLMKVDHRSNPGVSAQLSISLDSTPKSAVTIQITTPTGLSVDQATLTFAGNVVPVQQIVTISGNGQLTMTSSTQILNLSINASGGGLTSGGAARIPVQVMRRNRWVGNTGWTFTRNDRGNSRGNNSLWNTNLLFTRTGVALNYTANSTNYYTRDYVEVFQPQTGTRIRIYADRIDEAVAGSNQYRARVVNGAWQ